MNPKPQNEPSSPAADPPPKRAGDENASGLLRLVWMLIGNALLMVFGLTILLEPAWTITVRDGLFWGTVAALLVARYVDIARFGGLTVGGEPATRRHFVRYAAGVTGFSAAFWALSQSFHLLGPRHP